MIATVDRDIIPVFAEPRPFVLSRSHLAALEKLCLAKLTQRIGDLDGESIAKALLEGVTYFAFGEGETTKRAERALRLLKKIDAWQREEKDETSRENTKAVLWGALLRGWERTRDEEKEKTLAGGLLALGCFGHQEHKALSNVLRSFCQFGYPREKVALLLTLAHQNSNLIVLQFMAKELTKKLSPADFVKLGRRFVK
jgi:hypothetical protein